MEYTGTFNIRVRSDRTVLIQIQNLSYFREFELGPETRFEKLTRPFATPRKTQPNSEGKDPGTQPKPLINPNSSFFFRLLTELSDYGGPSEGPHVRRPCPRRRHCNCGRHLTLPPPWYSQDPHPGTKSLFAQSFIFTLNSLPRNRYKPILFSFDLFLR